MSRESESEQPQRTVAELLAEYGNSGEGAPRRRRRRAEDDDEVSGAQAIINRVNSDSGIMPAIRQDPQTGEPIPPASGRSHRRLRPVGQQPAPQQQAQQPPARPAPPQQAPQQSQQLPQRAPQPPQQQQQQQQPPQPPQQSQQPGPHAPTAYAQPVPPPSAAPNQGPNPGSNQQNPPTGRQQLPLSRPAMPPVASPPGQPPASRAPAAPPSRPAMPPAGGPTRGGMPPAGPPPGNAQVSRPAMPPVAPPPGRGTQQAMSRPPVDDYPDDDDFTEQGYGTPAQALLQNPQQPQQPPQPQPQQPLQSRFGGPSRPEAALTEELPPVTDEPPAQQVRPGQQTGTFRARPVTRGPVPDSPLEATQAHPGPLESTQAHPAPYLDDDEDEGFENEYRQDFPQDGYPDQQQQDGYPGERTQYARPPQPPPPGPRNQGTQLINPNQLAGDDDGYPDQDFEPNGYPSAEDYPQEDFASRGGSAGEEADLDPFDDPYDRDRREPIRGGEDDLDDVPAISTGREWLVTGAQVGVGAIAGAAVWLGFSWLWGFMPIVAIIAAVVVIIGLIVVVRKWRKAEDLQTTVLAILAGLVVTVSPAALLLVRR
ncbi:MAG TPA: hypothetical protein VHZ97_09700 [Pseudonocardiaceae bacterium]|nr:hypothetical protein [Pseudonocardiaceae bacterium]